MFRFPWGDFHSLNLGWFLQKFNELREDWARAEAGIDGALDAEIQKAEDALTDVFAARDAAAASASAANSSALNASQSSLASMDARDQSRAARDAAQQAAGNAAASETAAGNSATAASNSAGAAATSATQAGNSATAAGNSATAAGQSATNAAASETAAGNSAAAAAGSETAAAQSANDAEDAAASVEASAQQIATNAADIAVLKEANTLITPTQLWAAKSANVIDYDGVTNGRKLRIRNNYFKTEYNNDNPYRVIVLLNQLRVQSGALSSFTPEMADLVPITSLPVDGFVQTYVKHNSVVPSGNYSIYIIYANVENNIITRVGAGMIVNLANEGFQAHKIPTIPDNATHFTIIYYSPNSSLNAEAIWNIEAPNPDITALQATLLENIGG